MTANYLQCAKIRLVTNLARLKRILNEWKLYNGEAAMITTNEAIDRALQKHSYQSVKELYTTVRHLTGTTMSLETFARMFREWKEDRPHDEKWFRTEKGNGRYKKFKHKES
jgi:hypothetical protein